MFNNSRETLLDFSNGIASFLKDSEYLQLPWKIERI